MSDELTRAIAEALGCEESSFYGVGVCVAHGPGWPCRKAQHVAAAVTPLIEERVREARADELSRAADVWWEQGGSEYVTNWLRGRAEEAHDA